MDSLFRVSLGQNQGVGCTALSSAGSGEESDSKFIQILSSAACSWKIEVSVSFLASRWGLSAPKLPTFFDMWLLPSSEPGTVS